MPLCGKCHRDAQAGALFCAFCGGPIVPEPAAGEAADPHIGQTFKGMYFIQQKVGGGGMGQVYKAIHVTLDAPVALKILKKALLADPSVVQRFHREARAASRLRHPNVISVTDFGQTEDGTLFMAMEYVAGRSLGKVIAEEFPLSEQRVVHIAAQILAALAEAHAAQILHRDLKPENVMLEARRDEADSVKVLDFGIAKIQLPGDGRGTLTQAGLVCGTPGYMSPEQWSGEQLDARSDLYSVGVILYEMLTGKLPFEAETPMEMVRKHLTERPLPPSQRRADGEVSPDLEALVMRALSAKPADRPASAEEMRADLLACVLAPEPAPRAGGGPAKTMVMPKRPASSPPGKRPPSTPPGKRPSTPAEPAPSPEDVEAQPTRLAPAVASRTPVSTALPAQPGPRPRSRSRTG
jgi:serine/threonine-protein kinase